MRASRRVFPALLVLSLCLTFAAPGLAALTETEVSESLLCYACPGESLAIDRCGGGDEMRSAIRTMIGEGKSKKEILRYFVGRFGEDILASPPKRGFNLVAYFGPFLGLLVGAVAAVLIVRRWTSAGSRSGDEAGPDDLPPLDEGARRRVEEALSKLDEED